MLLWFFIGLCLLGFLFIFARWASNLPTNPLKRGLKILLILVAGIFMLIQAIRLMQYKDNQNAIRLMYTSIFYLSFIQIIFVLDKLLS